MYGGRKRGGIEREGEKERKKKVKVRSEAERQEEREVWGGFLAVWWMTEQTNGRSIFLSLSIPLRS
jgi:hypothetical protein